MALFIENGTIVNEGCTFKGDLLIENGVIAKIFDSGASACSCEEAKSSSAKSNFDVAKELVQTPVERIDASGKLILPGVIDDQVHMRTPGAEHKATLESESKAALLGGVTSYMDMPNNTPPTTTIELLEQKFKRAKAESYANYSFYLGATESNLEEIKAADKSRVCGIKLFMGSSTGNMLVEGREALEGIFAESPMLIATHCEDEQTIRANLAAAIERFGEEIPFSEHPNIRSAEACIKSTTKAIELAERFGSRLHILHISTAKELELIAAAGERITGEVCVHYMWFNSNDYREYGSKIKCNPAIKSPEDMLAIRQAVKEGIIKVVATDHAPHLWEEKCRNYLKAPSGLPLIRHSLQMMLELCKRGIFTLPQVVERMSHGPAECFNVERRGFIREGYWADIVLVDPSLPDASSTANPPYKCKWSPLAGTTFSHSITDVIINGVRAVKEGRLTGARVAMELKFCR